MPRRLVGEAAGSINSRIAARSWLCGLYAPGASVLSWRVLYGLAAPNYGPLATPENLLRVAHHAERRGLDSVFVADHVAVPERIASIYPYDRAARPAPANLRQLEHLYDSLTALAFLAGATARIRLGVSVYVLPIRNPVVTAKTVASLDALCGGRVIFGCGTGWLREEFECLHAPFEKRGAVTDEYLGICKAVWTQEVVSFSGPTYCAPAVHGGPRPRQKPHPPVWIGGNSRRAIERAARLGDAWHPIDLSPPEIAAKGALLREACAAAGRDPGAVTISLRHAVRVIDGDCATASGELCGTPEKIRDDIAAYAGAGVDHLLLHLRHARGVDELLAELDRLVDEVLD